MELRCIEHVDLMIALSIIGKAGKAGKHAYKSKCKHCKRWIIKQSSVNS